MNAVPCPHCGKNVEINQAFKHQFEEDILREERSKNKEQLEKLKEEIEINAQKRIKEELEFKLKDSKNEIEEAKKKNEELQSQLLELTKLLRELKTKDEQRELEMQKKLNSEREKIAEDLSKTLKERSDLENAELKKQLDDTKKALEEAQRKAAQKSQQLQGEVLELDLETQLQECFPTDEIKPVPKGIEGADIFHKVNNKFGQTAGVLLWETKRTKSWSNSWLPKLREEKRKIENSIPILITDALPEGIENFGFYENVWVTSYTYAIPLANVLRISLFELAIAKSTASHKDERLEALFGYLAQGTFRNRFEAQVESIIALKNDLEVEQRSTIRIWKKRETEIKRLMNSVAMMYGELQGIMGQSLPSIQSLDSVGLLEDKKSEQESLLE